MSDESPMPSTEAPEDRPARVAAGRLRTHPDAPQTTWAPEPGAGQPLGSLEQRAEGRMRDGLRRVQGQPGLAAAGWTVFILGGAIYVYGLWATANAVLAGDASPEQVVAVGGFDILLGSLGLVLLVVGLACGLIFTFLPVRWAPPLVPGTLDFEVAAENLVHARDLRRIIIWVGLGVFLLGVVLAAYPLRQTVMGGELYSWQIGGMDYRIHLWGYLMVFVGGAVTVALVLAQPTVENAVPVVEATLPEGRVRRAEERGPPGPGEEVAEDDAVARGRARPRPITGMVGEGDRSDERPGP